MRGSAELDTAKAILTQPGVLAAVVVGSAVIGVLAWLLGARRGWSRLAAALAGCGLAVALSVTIARPGVLDTSGQDPGALRACLRTPFSLSSVQDKLNLVMLMPFAFFATLATRRALPVMACCAVLSGGIEAFQAVSGIGVCEANDWYTNTLGAVLAAAVGRACTTLSPGERNLQHG